MASSTPRPLTATAPRRRRKRAAATSASAGKGDKVVAFCDRHCNLIAPFVAAPGNRNESPLLREALPEVMRISRQVGLDLQGAVVSLDGVYDWRANRRAIFNRGMVPNINPNPRGRQQPKQRFGINTACGDPDHNRDCVLSQTQPRHQFLIRATTRSQALDVDELFQIV
jgi:hypothetical protein